MLYELLFGFSEAMAFISCIAALIVYLSLVSIAEGTNVIAVGTELLIGFANLPGQC